MKVRQFALIFGIIYLIVGLAGFIPALLQPPLPNEPDVDMHQLHGRLLGLFPVNVLHTIVHLAIGLWGVIAAKSQRAAITYAQGLAILYGLLAVMGLIPGLNTMFGLVPLYGHDVWLHAGSALIAAYFGFIAKDATRTA